MTYTTHDPEGQVPPPLQPVTLHISTVKPVVSYVLLGSTVLVFLLQLLSQFLFQYDLPAILGAKMNDQIRAGEFWRLITPIFLHGSVIHIAFNMYALYVIGLGLEHYYGYRRFLLLYLLGGISGNLASFIFTPAASYGASTAIFGLVAAQGVFIYRNRFLFGKNARNMLINIAGIILVNLALGLSPGIDNWGHLGGLLGGLVFAWFAGPVYQITGNPPDIYLNEKKPLAGYLLVAAVELLAVAGLFAFFL